MWLYENTNLTSWTLISSSGIQLLPEKLRSIENMPAPRSPKEVKQFLGLAGYYHKFIPRFSDLSRPLTRLTRKDVLFEWTKECQSCFELLKEKLCTYSILWYPDLSHMCFSLMLVSMDGQESSCNPMKKSTSQISQLPIYIHQDGRQFITLYHTSVDYLEGVGSTGLPL